jgi:tetratricopeptide (TPR) repeat protein
VHIDFKSTSIDKLYVKKNLCDYDVVHFAGHCEYEPQNSRDSGWVLSDAKLSVQDILGMGSAASLPPLIFSNSCYSAQSDPEGIETNFQESNYNLASAFLFAGVRHYIGAIRRIEDKVSLDFSKEFYAQLINGSSVGESLRLGRLKLIREYGVGSIHWAGYLLYGDPNFVLFKGKEKSVKNKAAKKSLFLRKRIVFFFAAAVALALIVWLSLFLPTLNPATYARFRKLNKYFYSGNNALTISLAGEILRKEPSFLAVYPLLGDTYQRTGDRDNALRYYFDYARLSEKKPDTKNLAEAYLKIGWVYHLENDYAKAFDFYSRAIAIAQKGMDKLHEAAGLRKLAVWYIDKKDYVQALELLTKSSEINRERMHLAGYRYNLACDYFDMGLIFTNKEDFQTAKGFYQKSRILFEKLKARNELSDCYFNLGEVYLYEKEFQKALDYYLAGLKIDQAQGNKMNLGGDYNMIGELYAEMDNSARAEEYFKLAVSIAEDINNRSELASGYHNLGLLYRKRGLKNKAREYLRQAQEIYYKSDSEAYQEVKKELLDLTPAS